MRPAAFVDTDIPVHTADSGHSLKGLCVRILRMVFKKSEPCVIVSGVLQESMHRYPASSPGRLPPGGSADLHLSHAAYLPTDLTSIPQVGWSRHAWTAGPGV